MEEMFKITVRTILNVLLAKILFSVLSHLNKITGFLEIDVQNGHFI
jgi:hypothetical protein